MSITSGELGSWALRRTPRRTCARCGTRMFTEPDERVRGVLATLLPKGTFRPRFHIHCESALVKIHHGLPHCAALPKQMGGSGDVVDW